MYTRLLLVLVLTVCVAGTVAQTSSADDYENMYMVWGGDGGADPDTGYDEDEIPDQWEDAREERNPDDPSWDEILIPPVKEDEKKEYGVTWWGALIYLSNDGSYYYTDDGYYGEADCAVSSGDSSECY